MFMLCLDIKIKIKTDTGQKKKNKKKIQRLCKSTEHSQFAEERGCYCGRVSGFM